MKFYLHPARAFLLLHLLASVLAQASVYNARPKLIVIIIIDQFRGDYLERYSDQFGTGGFRMFLDHGAVFTDCYYDYANTRTAPGHATLLTGAYTNGHGILINEWWDPRKNRIVTSVEDETTRIVAGQGVSRSATLERGTGSSPRNLLASTLGDELKLATQGRARVFGISLKDRAAVLPAGWSGDGAYWIDRASGAWITSTYYRKQLPDWVSEFNRSNHADKYWNLEWKDSAGKTLRTTERKPGASFYEVVGITPFANDYELDFARALIVGERLGSGPASDLLVISLSANDILGHKVGPDSPQIQAMALALDRQLAAFFDFLRRQLGLANVWVALSADHGTSPVLAVAKGMRIPATAIDNSQLRSQLNAALSSEFSPRQPRVFVPDVAYPDIFLSGQAFAAVHMKEADAERAVGAALLRRGMQDYFTRAQLEHGQIPSTKLGYQYLHSYSPYGGWYVLGVPPPYSITSRTGAEHGSPYSYDTHVPLAFFGAPFHPGMYRTHAEPVDLAATLASLLGINAPTHAIGRVLTEAIAAAGEAQAAATGLP
ncbi:MAG: phosphodiesterase [Acidobacteria bacterium]|nr:MAG: phosphodiesterase [Acidobacteriota bacterium]